jgi:hypothetical protein
MKRFFLALTLLVFKGVFAQSIISPYLNFQSQDTVLFYSNLSMLQNETSYQEIHFIEKGFLSLIGDSMLEDADLDGVSNFYDECVATPIESTVDVNGCETFTLPPDSFQIKVTHNSCPESEEGIISISTSLNEFDFEVLLNGQSHDWLSPSTEPIEFTNLESNTYSLCLIPKSNPTYQRCYEISIRNPAPLEVQSFTNWDAKTVLLQLRGEPPFTVNHNKNSIETSEKFYQLNLVKGVNTISVTPSSECQGSFDSELFLSEDVRIFPNPIKDIANIYVGGSDTKVQLTLKDFNSQQIELKTLEIPSNRIIQLSVNHLKTGMYFIELKSLEVQKELKLIKA